MSLINQMLKDLEQRGAKPTEIQPSVIPQFGHASTKRSSNRVLAITAALITSLILGYFAFSMFAQQNRLHGIFGFKNTTETNINPTHNQSTLINPAKFGQAIQDKGIAHEDLPETAINSANDANEANINPRMQPNKQSNSLFETTLKYNINDNTEQINDIPRQPTKSEKNNAKTVKSTSASNSEKKIIEPIESKTDQNEPSPKENHSTQPSKASAPSPIANKPLANINKKISPEQNANSYYQQALIYLQQGRVAESQANLAKALEFNPTHHEARLTLASLLLDNKRLMDAKEVLNTGLQISPEQNEFRIALARLQINAGDQATALSTLEHGLQYATNHADYQAFLATLLQRTGRHEDAVTHYMKAVSLETNAGNIKNNTLVGLGISLQALGKFESAQQAFTKAQQTGTLGPALSGFVEQQLKKIKQNLIE